MVLGNLLTERLGWNVSCVASLQVGSRIVTMCLSRCKYWVGLDGRELLLPGVQVRPYLNSNSTCT